MNVDCGRTEVTGFPKLAKRFPQQVCSTARGTISYLATSEVESNAPPPLVLLHGIGSSAGSWVSQLADLERRVRVLAWDAPGYGASTPIAKARPTAEDYAHSLRAWLAEMGVRECVLVGHSWGAIIATAYVAMGAGDVAGLLLLSPARGYGCASALVREERRHGRIDLVDGLGMQRMAEQRAGALLSENASEDALSWVKAMMGAIPPDGYRAATHMLCDSDLVQASERMPPGVAVKVVVGSEDSITPVAQCAEIATKLGGYCQVLSGIGHACHVEAPAEVTQVVRLFHTHDCQVMLD